MSGIPRELRLGGVALRRPSTLPTRAWIYFGTVAAVTVGIAAPLVPRVDSGTDGWAAFLVLSACAALAQLFVVRTTRDQSYHTSSAFLIAGALLLPPELVVLMGVVQHIPEWLKHRYAWYIQSFNICNFTLDGLAAWGVARLVRDQASWLGSEPRVAVAGLAACVVFVGLNHVLMAGMLYLARGHRPVETGLFSLAMLSTELVVASIGIGVAAFWHANAALIPFALAPLLLIHRSLHVPQLEEQARIDPKTGLFNSRHFAVVLTEELARARRFDRPAALIMADLDLLREINNAYGHLVGDEVLAGVAEIFRDELRHYDVPARFGGEEFAILLPETGPEQAFEIAERIRRAVARRIFEFETVNEPVRVTISMGVASYPHDGQDPNELVHHADLAVYRAKLQGRNRVLDTSGEHLLVRPDRVPRLVGLPGEEAPTVAERRRSTVPVAHDRRRSVRTAKPRRRRHHVVLTRLTALVGVVAGAGVGAGVIGMVFGGSTDVLGMIAVTGLVGVGQALSLEVEDGSISVGAVGAIAGAALFDFRTALPIAVVSSLVDWSARRTPLHRVLFNVGALSLAAIASAGVFAAGETAGLSKPLLTVTAIAAAGAYYAVNIGLLGLALGFDGRTQVGYVWRERFLWLLPHYVAFGFAAGVIAVAYDAVGIVALGIAVLPLFLIRKSQEAYLAHTEESARQLREAAETIHSQNVSLQTANRLLRERSTAAMESLSATVDARDAFTAGHSRRVQRLALAIGRNLRLSQPELDLLSHAALFHDIGKLAIPDAILMKPARLDTEEWRLMRRHPDEGARIIDRLGFLSDAVPAIRHHHERFDGSGYPEGLRGEEIPLGARIIHVADALDSMLTSRIYRPALPEDDALAELRHGAGTQFCPRCVQALEDALAVEADSRRELLAV